MSRLEVHLGIIFIKSFSIDMRGEAQIATWHPTAGPQLFFSFLFKPVFSPLSFGLIEHFPSKKVHMLSLR
jgi:hypothetical protein